MIRLWSAAIWLWYYESITTYPWPLPSWTNAKYLYFMWILYKKIVCINRQNTAHKTALIGNDCVSVKCVANSIFMNTFWYFSITNIVNQGNRLLNIDKISILKVEILNCNMHLMRIHISIQVYFVNSCSPILKVFLHKRFEIYLLSPNVCYMSHCLCSLWHVQYKGLFVHVKVCGFHGNLIYLLLDEGCHSNWIPEDCTL